MIIEGLYEKTVAAISTPAGTGGVAMIRVSGSHAFEICEKLFKPKNNRRIIEIPPNTAVYGSFFDGDGVFDDGIVIFFKSPRSYTGEDTAELCCHGGLLVTQKLLKTVISCGADYAQAGEFTKRAFINGRLSLSAAEAVAGIISAKSEKHLSVSLLQLEGSLAKKLRSIFDRLSYIAASVYAYIDYPEEDMTDVSVEEMSGKLEDIYDELIKLKNSYKYGKAISDGVSAAIIGRPNVGKSSFLNLLADSERAIVTGIAGTTRDVVTQQIILEDMVINLSDTAGIRESGDAVEKIGISRSLEQIEKSDLIFYITDSEPAPEDELIISTIREKGKSKNTIAVYNKADIQEAKPRGSFANEIIFSAKTGFGKEKLAKMTAGLYNSGITADLGNIITTARQYASVTRAAAAVNNALNALDIFTQDVAVSDIEEALAAIGELDGRSVSETVVNEIFSHFCVGK